jgi:hypothetical protein
VSLFEDGIVSEERLLAALERIALCLEVMSGLGRPDEGAPTDVSDVSYVDDMEELAREIRKEAYERRTGRRLPNEEDVPRPTALGWSGTKD